MTNRKVILLVEDSPADEELTLRALDQSHVSNEIVVVRDGEEALDYLIGSNTSPTQGLPPLPQVVLLDLHLPKVGGLEVLRQVRANPRTQLLPIVILTSSSEEEDVISSYRLGANSYVRKPVGFQHFAEAVQQLSLYWVLINQPPPPPATQIRKTDLLKG
jgi:two-component system, response regulator